MIKRGSKLPNHSVYTLMELPLPEKRENNLLQFFITVVMN